MTSLVSLRFLVLSVLLVYILTLLLQPSGFMTHLFSQLLLFSLDLCVLGSALNTLDSSLLCLAVLPGNPDTHLSTPLQILKIISI